MKNTKGITLVALVITIIILLILAGISIQTITQTNLFKKAEQAKEETEQAQEKENEMLSNYIDSMNEYLPDTLADKVKKGKIEIGSYVNYSPDTINNEKYKELISNLATYSGNTNKDYNTAETIKQEELKWRILDVKDGQVRLISAITGAKIGLTGYNAYNNGVKLLDDTCSTLYNSKKLASKVQNLKIEDIGNKLKEKDYSKIDSNYGKTYTYKGLIAYPSMLLKDKEQEVTIGGKTIKGTELGISEQNEYIKQETENKTADVLKIKNTSWVKNMNEEDFENSKYYELFIKNENYYNNYWLSSRCVGGIPAFANYCIYRVDVGLISGISLYSSNPGTELPEYRSCRPVITLNSNVQIDTTNSGNGTENSPYNIK
jgi:type II secretory pathway pseudopilin PulG